MLHVRATFLSLKKVVLCLEIKFLNKVNNQNHQSIQTLTQAISYCIYMIILETLKNQ